MICIAALGASGCTGGIDNVSADVPVATSTAAEPSAVPALATVRATPAPPVPVTTTTPVSVDPATDGRSLDAPVPFGTTLTFYDRNAIGDKGAVTVLSVKDWDGTGPGDDSGVAIEVELTLAPDALIPLDSIVTTEPWSAVDKNGSIYRASWVGTGDPSPGLPAPHVHSRRGDGARVDPDRRPGG